MHRKCFVLCLFASIQAFGGNITLWDQQPGSGEFIINQEFPDGPGASVYEVNDVTVSGGGWNINSITEYFTSENGNWPATFDARLNIFSNTGTLPLSSDHPTSGALLVVSNNNGTITMGGLNIDLAPGNYWIGFTPTLNFSFGQEFQLFAGSTLGNSSALLNPGGAFGVGPDWVNGSAFGHSNADGSITIAGTIAGNTQAPEPGVFQLMVPSLGILGLLYRRKARRANR